MTTQPNGNAQQVLTSPSLKLQRDKLKQYQKKVRLWSLVEICAHYFLMQIQVVLDREHEIAKAHLANGQKERAVIALRRRKYQQGLLLKTDSELETLEQLVCVSFKFLETC